MLLRLREESGAIAVIVALVMVALLAAVAIALDVGHIDIQQSQLQNGTDAAALAVAQNCAAAPTAPNCASPAALARTLVAQNDTGISSALTPGTPTITVTFPTANSVTVIAQQDLPLSFAPVIGVKDKVVSARSTAAWGTPSGGPDELALTFPPCVFHIGGIQLIQTAGSTPNCSSTSPSGKLLPGNFGWLTDAGNCTATVTVGSQAFGRPGVDASADCQTSLHNDLGKTVLLPIFSDDSGTGAGVQYTISGWAAFQLLGYHFPSTNTDNTVPGYTGPSCTGNCKGIMGQFLGFVTLDTAFTLDPNNPGTDYNTRTVRLTS